MWNCCVSNCLSSRSKGAKLTPFPDPVKQRIKFLTWVRACGNPNLLKLNPFRVRKLGICRKHFAIHPLMVRVPTDAVPELLLPEPIDVPESWIDDSIIVDANVEDINIQNFDVTTFNPEIPKSALPSHVEPSAFLKSTELMTKKYSAHVDGVNKNSRVNQNSNAASSQQLNNVQTNNTNIQHQIKEQSDLTGFWISYSREIEETVPWYIASERAPKTYSKYCNETEDKNINQIVETPNIVLTALPVAPAHCNVIEQVAGVDVCNDASTDANNLNLIVQNQELHLEDIHDAMDVDSDCYDELLVCTENREDDIRLRTHCRICALECTDMINIFEESNKDILEILRICTDIEFLESDFLPKQICQTCKLEVTACHKFKLKTNKSDIFLRELFLDINNDNSNTQEESNENELKCKTCGKVSKTYAGFEKHKYKYEKDPCDFCVICYKKIEHSMQKHMSIHKGDRPYKCLLCGRAYLSRGSLIDHQNAHRQTSSFKCPICKKGFASSNSLYLHKETHKVKKRTYLCSICGAKFATSRSFEIHNEKHIGVKDIECSRCDKKFYTTTQRAVHLRLHCKNTNNEPAICFVCGEVCSNQPELEKHFLEHPDQKLYNCRICGVEFSYMKEFNTHVKSHTGPFECLFCDKSFHESSILDNHHTKAHKFCELCGETYSSREHLRRHKRNTHTRRDFKKKNCDEINQQSEENTKY